ncbi:hypothetical protein Vadar_000467 [Vaccinium darrowii]|uniref:Uncharacterized protein n=1 Tax=Vaccinium darrowii TaxID=229202 RepID=A0ACB7YAU2_9ERIC|nr:hypothetical protein Vadar_000467 [Vaccinium darrowii]
MKSLSTLPFLFLHFSLLITTSVSAASLTKIPRLSVLHESFTRGTAKNISASASVGLETFFYPQTLDHFNYQPESYATFQHRYMMNSQYWGGANESAPIFVYLGDEAALDGQPEAVGFLLDNAPHFKSLLVYIEHRFYGQSIPFGLTMQEAMNNASTRGYFNSAQALADCAELVIYLKEKLHAHNSPVIVVGGSYGGMLAAWFRLKYPHVALGALASSAPILYFNDITPQDGYFSVVQRDFQEASYNCYETIRQSWSEMDRVASMPNGLANLSQTFHTCSTLSSAAELESYLIGLYAGAAQYDFPPSYPVAQFCGGVDGAKQGTGVLGKIFAGLVALTGNQTCYVNQASNSPSVSNVPSDGWSWQACSEMLIPISIDSKDTMFPQGLYGPFNFTQRSLYCKSVYGVPSRPNWVTTYYGGYDIKLVLRRFGSNIIFSNGLRDPYSSGGVLENLSDTLLAVYTAQDLRFFCDEIFNPFGTRVGIFDCFTLLNCNRNLGFPSNLGFLYRVPYFQIPTLYTITVGQMGSERQRAATMGDDNPGQWWMSSILERERVRHHAERKKATDRGEIRSIAGEISASSTINGTLVPLLSLVMQLRVELSTFTELGHFTQSLFPLGATFAGEDVQAIVFPLRMLCQREKGLGELQTQACKSILAVNIVVEPVTVKGDGSKAMLFDASMLAQELKRLGSERMWKIISKVWVELMSYAAGRCRANTHATQLSKGGELLSLVWLLMARLGIGDQFQISEGHARAKLIVTK